MHGDDARCYGRTRLDKKLDARFERMLERGQSLARLILRHHQYLASVCMSLEINNYKSITESDGIKGRGKVYKRV